MVAIARSNVLGGEDKGAGSGVSYPGVEIRLRSFGTIGYRSPHHSANGGRPTGQTFVRSQIHLRADVHRRSLLYDRCADLSARLSRKDDTRVPDTAVAWRSHVGRAAELR